MKSIVQFASFLAIVFSNFAAYGFGVEREMKESGEKGGTTDINIGVGELQECTLSGVDDIGLISSYSFEIAYDPSVLNFLSVEDLLFGAGELTPTLTPSSIIFSASGPAPASSVGDFFELSFSGNALGSSTLSVIDEAVFDSQAVPQELPDAGANPLTINVVPEPASALVVTVGLVGLAGLRPRRKPVESVSRRRRC